MICRDHIVGKAFSEVEIHGIRLLYVCLCLLKSFVIQDWVLSPFSLTWCCGLIMLRSNILFKSWSRSHYYIHDVYTFLMMSTSCLCLINFDVFLSFLFLIWYIKGFSHKLWIYIDCYRNENLTSTILLITWPSAIKGLRNRKVITEGNTCWIWK